MAAVSFALKPIIYTSLGKPSTPEISMEEDVHLHHWMAVKGVGIAYTTGADKFAQMENAHVSVDRLDGHLGQAFFGVFDGHGGKSCANFLAQHLPTNYTEVAKTNSVEKISWTGVFAKTDAMYNAYAEATSCGAAAACVVIKSLEGKLVASCANVGDVKAIAIRDGKAVQLTEEHTVKRHHRDVYKLTQAGGVIDGGKISGRLDCTRMFGVESFKHVSAGRKRSLVAVEPYSRLLLITPEVSHLVIATSGLWDKVSDESVVETVSQFGDDTKAAARQLIDASYGSGKNVTVMIIDIRGKLRSFATGSLEK